MRSYRTYFLLSCLAWLAALQILAQTQPLVVERRGNQLHVASIQPHFFEGSALEQLHNGASVTFILTLSLTAEGSPTLHARERFIVSYDLWEEKFAVMQAGSPGRSASHLTSGAAESWCVNSLVLPIPKFNPDKVFTVKLECIVDSRERAGTENNTGLTLASLIDLFSRKNSAAPPHWEASSGPLRLADIKDAKLKDAKSIP